MRRVWAKTAKLPKGARKELSMAKQKNVVLVSGRTKLVLFPRKSDEGRLIEPDQQTSKAIRKAVQEFVENDSRDLPYHERLKANKRVGLKNGNQLAKNIRSIIDAQDASQPEPELELEVASTPSIEDAMEEAEKVNAIKRSNLPKVVKEALLLSL
jgi:hypothetical protein